MSIEHPQKQEKNPTKAQSPPPLVLNPNSFPNTFHTQPSSFLPSKLYINSSMSSSSNCSSLACCKSCTRRSQVALMLRHKVPTMERVSFKGSTTTEGFWLPVRTKKHRQNQVSIGPCTTNIKNVHRQNPCLDPK